jgi:hypothetical protein
MNSALPYRPSLRRPPSNREGVVASIVSTGSSTAMSLSNARTVTVSPDRRTSGDAAGKARVVTALGRHPVRSLLSTERSIIRANLCQARRVRDCLDADQLLGQRSA